MGMFDTVYFDYPLPDTEAQECDFQTKDLDKEMNTFCIDEDGELLLIQRSKDEEELEEALVIPFHGKLNLSGSLNKCIHEPPIICIDEYEDEFVLVRQTRYDYVATFTSGVLTRIERKTEPSSDWSFEALDGSYSFSTSFDEEEFERLLAIELQKPDNRRIIIPEEEFVYEEPNSIKTIGDIPAPILERIKQLRYDRILEKHEGPWNWSSALKYGDACILSLTEKKADVIGTVLMPFDERFLEDIEVTFCDTMPDGMGGGKLLLFFVCPSLAGYDNAEGRNRQWSGFCAVCNRIPIDDESTEYEDFYVTVMLHETFFLEPEMSR